MQRTVNTVGIGRRTVLIGAGLLALAATAPACDNARPTIDRLQVQRELALRDSESAAAAARAPTNLQRALKQVAAERAAHAEALATEIARVAGAPETTTVTSTPGVGEPPTPSLADVITALRDSADSAGQLAAELSGYRAGLLASIAAACTAAHTVALSVKP